MLKSSIKLLINDGNIDNDNHDNNSNNSNQAIKSRSCTAFTQVGDDCLGRRNMSVYIYAVHMPLAEATLKGF